MSDFLQPAFYALMLDGVFSFLVGGAIVLLLLRVTYKNRIFDMPDERKIHDLPIPRLGGMSFLPTLLLVGVVTIGALYQQNLVGSNFLESKQFTQMAYMLGGAMVVYFVGIADDLSDVGFKIKFAAQFIAASIMAASGLWMRDLFGLYFVHQFHPAVGIPFSILLMMYITNSINMIDGIDGLASGLSMIALGCLAFIFMHEHRFLYSMVSISTLGAVAAFWCFNVFGTREKKRKLFMGDTGSLTLGVILSYLIICLSFLRPANGPTRNCKYLIVVFSSLMLPMLDVLRLIVYRLKHHKNPFKADMNHIHHKFLQLGFTQRQALFILLGIDVALIALNALLSMVLEVNVLFVLDVLIYYVIIKVLTVKIIKLERENKVVFNR